MPNHLPFGDPASAKVTLADALTAVRQHDAAESDRRVAAELERCALIGMARAAGATWDDLGAALGVTATAVRLRFNAHTRALA